MFQMSVQTYWCLKIQSNWPGQIHVNKFDKHWMRKSAEFNNDSLVCDDSDFRTCLSFGYGIAKGCQPPRSLGPECVPNFKICHCSQTLSFTHCQTTLVQPSTSCGMKIGASWHNCQLREVLAQFLKSVGGTIVGEIRCTSNFRNLF